jgi:splicing factor U2AF 65 kDa subunit
VLLLKNLVDKNEIQDDNEHFDILDDVKSECSQHGHVRSVIIPRVKDGYPVSAEGSVFVEFGDVESAKRASQSLKGRKFADRMVLADYVSLLSLFFPLI